MDVLEFFQSATMSLGYALNWKKKKKIIILIIRKVLSAG